MSDDFDEEFVNIANDISTEYEAYPGKSEKFSVAYKTNAPDTNPKDVEIEVFDSEDYKRISPEKEHHKADENNGKVEKVNNNGNPRIRNQPSRKREFNPREIVKHAKDMESAKKNALSEANKAMQYADKYYLLAEHTVECAYTNPAYESYEELAKSLSRTDEKTLCLIEKIMEESRYRGTEKKMVREAIEKSKVLGDIETAEKFISENNLDADRDKYDGSYKDVDGKEQSKKELDALLKMELGQLEVLVALHHAEKWTDTRTLLAESRLKNSGRTANTGQNDLDADPNPPFL